MVHALLEDTIWWRDEADIINHLNPQVISVCTSAILTHKHYTDKSAIVEYYIILSHY